MENKHNLHVFILVLLKAVAVGSTSFSFCVDGSTSYNISLLCSAGSYIHIDTFKAGAHSGEYGNCSFISGDCTEELKDLVLSIRRHCSSLNNCTYNAYVGSYKFNGEGACKDYSVPQYYLIEYRCFDKAFGSCLPTESHLNLSCAANEIIQVVHAFVGVHNDNSSTCSYRMGDCTGGSAQLLSISEACAGRQICEYKLRYNSSDIECPTLSSYHQVWYKCIKGSNVLDMCYPARRQNLPDGYISSPGFPADATLADNVNCSCELRPRRGQRLDIQMVYISMRASDKVDSRCVVNISLNNIIVCPQYQWTDNKQFPIPQARRLVIKAAIHPLHKTKFWIHFNGVNTDIRCGRHLEEFTTTTINPTTIITTTTPVVTSSTVDTVPMSTTLTNTDIFSTSTTSISITSDKTMTPTSTTVENIMNASTLTSTTTDENTKTTTTADTVLSSTTIKSTSDTTIAPASTTVDNVLTSTTITTTDKTTVLASTTVDDALTSTTVTSNTIGKTTVPGPTTMNTVKTYSTVVITTTAPASTPVDSISPSSSLTDTTTHKTTREAPRTTHRASSDTSTMPVSEKGDLTTPSSYTSSGTQVTTNMHKPSSFLSSTSSIPVSGTLHNTNTTTSTKYSTAKGTSRNTVLSSQLQTSTTSASVTMKTDSVSTGSETFTSQPLPSTYSKLTSNISKGYDKTTVTQSTKNTMTPLATQTTIISTINESSRTFSAMISGENSSTASDAEFLNKSSTTTSIIEGYSSTHTKAVLSTTYDTATTSYANTSAMDIMSVSAHSSGNGVQIFGAVLGVVVTIVIVIAVIFLVRRDRLGKKNSFLFRHFVINNDPKLGSVDVHVVDDRSDKPLHEAGSSLDGADETDSRSPDDTRSIGAGHINSAFDPLYDTPPDESTCDIESDQTFLKTTYGSSEIKDNRSPNAYEATDLQQIHETPTKSTEIQVTSKLNKVANMKDLYTKPRRIKQKLKRKTIIEKGLSDDQDYNTSLSGTRTSVMWNPFQQDEGDAAVPQNSSVDFEQKSSADDLESVLLNIDDPGNIRQSVTSSLSDSRQINPIADSVHSREDAPGHHFPPVEGSLNDSSLVDPVTDYVLLNEGDPGYSYPSFHSSLTDSSQINPIAIPEKSNTLSLASDDDVIRRVPDSYKMHPNSFFHDSEDSIAQKYEDTPTLNMRDKISMFNNIEARPRSTGVGFYEEIRDIDLKPIYEEAKHGNDSMYDRRSRKMPIPVTETESAYSECRDLSKPIVIQDAEMYSEVHY